MEVRSVRRATELLRCIGMQPGMPLTELAAATSLSKTTTLRILQTLIRSHFVTEDALAGVYYPGPIFLQLGLTSEPFEGLKRVARLHLERLRDAVGETAALVVLRGADRMTVDVAVGLHELKSVPEIGSVKPIHAGAAGKALLAALPEADAIRLIEQKPFTKVARSTIELPKALLRALNLVRARGYARSLEETVNGQGAIAAAILCDTALVAAVNLCVPAVRFSENFVKKAVPHVLAAAGDISRALGTTSKSDARRLQSIRGIRSKRAALAAGE